MTTVDEAWAALTRGESAPAPGDEGRKAVFEAGWNAVIEATGGTDHLVQVTETGWTIQHPITDRLEGDLFGCPFNDLVRIAGEQGDLGPGRYKIWLDRSALQWEEVDA